MIPVQKIREVEEFERWYSEISSNIWAYAKALGFRPTPQQAQLLDAVQRGDRRIACRSGQGPGKTRAMVCVAGWMGISKPFSKVIITAPSMHQCKDVFLAEFTMVHQAAKDPRLQQVFTFLKSSIGIFGHSAEQWGIQAVTASSPEALQGLHRENMTIIMEEASGIDPKLVEALEGTCSGPTNYLFAIGNPNNRSGPFFEFFHRDRHNWKCLHWNAEETPESVWFSKERNRYVAEKYGIDSDVYRVRVKGEFPLSDADALIPPDILENAMRFDPVRFEEALKFRRADGTIRKHIGSDFARYGNDESVNVRVMGNAVVDFEVYQHKEPNDVVMRSFVMQRQAGWSDEECMYIPDANGMGQGIVFRYNEYAKNAHLFYAQASSTAQDYANKITEAWFQFSILLKNHPVYIKKDPRLFEQLTNRRYFMEKKSGKLIVESKDEYMRRGFDSPDRADAVVMAFYESTIARSQFASKSNPDEQGKPGQVVYGVPQRVASRPFKMQESR